MTKKRKLYYFHIQHDGSEIDKYYCRVTGGIDENTRIPGTPFLILIGVHCCHRRRRKPIPRVIGSASPITRIRLVWKQTRLVPRIVTRFNRFCHFSICNPPTTPHLMVAFDLRHQQPTPNPVIEGISRPSPELGMAESTMPLT